jgi:DMSO/TMAO reductase YedYZ heme-binding membrane subunit
MILGLLLGIVAVFAAKYIRKYEWASYILALALAITLFVVDNQHLLAEFAIGFFLVVMYAGVFTSKSKVGKGLRGVRKQYAIMGTVFGLIHGLYYIFDGQLEWAGIISLVAILPLTYTSFIFARKRMTNKSWKLLHKLSYVVYAGLFAHMMLLGEYPYALAFGIYFIMKEFYEFRKVRYNKVTA